MNKYYPILEPEKLYHIYNHAVGESNIFKSEDNYYFFLEKYMQYISPYVDTFAYCLLPNHFHLAVRIKELQQLQQLSKSSKLLESSVSNFLSKQFSNFFSCYTQSFNKQQIRRGGLFEQKFRRKLIETDEYFKNLIHYIHYNPVHHGFVEDLRDWKFSSYQQLSNSNNNNNNNFPKVLKLLESSEVLNWFNNDINEFIEFHKIKSDFNKIKNIIIE